MRVDNMEINVRQSNLVKPAGAETSTRGTRRTDAVASTDQAGVSGLSGLLSLAMQVSDTQGSSRVDELRNAIQSGSYSMNLGDVSRSIVDSALRLD